MRVALHHPAVHVFLRAAGVFGVFFFPLAACVIAVDALNDGEVAPALLVAGIAAVGVLLVRVTCRVHRVWATPEGLEIARGRARRLVAWDRLVAIRRPWWDFSVLYPFFELEIAGEGRVLLVGTQRTRDVIARFGKTAA